MQSIRYITRCIYCGKQGSNNMMKAGGPPKSTPSAMVGKCPSSPNGKHAPRWEEA